MNACTTLQRFAHGRVALIYTVHILQTYQDIPCHQCASAQAERITLIEVTEINRRYRAYNLPFDDPDVQAALALVPENHKLWCVGCWEKYAEGTHQRGGSS